MAHGSGAINTHSLYLQGPWSLLRYPGFLESNIGPHKPVSRSRLESPHAHRRDITIL
ncbi:hypothetical protein ASPCADRAFT_210499 [Aspergillus carbonarius ITEM 5010]|uniref:Uncharacterized protein n=1 Tax=Aspergillus carbonarius (strain ITEM 5010) TaxID=602072 RepID=A0A1R3RC91_ASPC5|nr:hypothetical protein ASPCADRAFT_210499 [Aspergillus carbonarius ITEM 5010]